MAIWDWACFDWNSFVSWIAIWNLIASRFHGLGFSSMMQTCSVLDWFFKHWVLKFIFWKLHVLSIVLGASFEQLEHTDNKLLCMSLVGILYHYLLMIWLFYGLFVVDINLKFALLFSPSIGGLFSFQGHADFDDLVENDFCSFWIRNELVWGHLLSIILSSDKLHANVCHFQVDALQGFQGGS